MGKENETTMNTENNEEFVTDENGNRVGYDPTVEAYDPPEDSDDLGDYGDYGDDDQRDNGDYGDDDLPDWVVKGEQPPTVDQQITAGFEPPTEKDIEELKKLAVRKKIPETLKSDFDREIDRYMDEQLASVQGTLYNIYGILMLERARNLHHFVCAAGTNRELARKTAEDTYYRFGKEIFEFQKKSREPGADDDAKKRFKQSLIRNYAETLACLAILEGDKNAKGMTKAQLDEAVSAYCNIGFYKELTEALEPSVLLKNMGTQDNGYFVKRVMEEMKPEEIENIRNLIAPKATTAAVNNTQPAANVVPDTNAEPQAAPGNNVIQGEGNDLNVSFDAENPEEEEIPAQEITALQGRLRKKTEDVMGTIGDALWKNTGETQSAEKRREMTDSALNERRVRQHMAAKKCKAELKERRKTAAQVSGVGYNELVQFVGVLDWDAALTDDENLNKLAGLAGANAKADAARKKIIIEKLNEMNALSYEDLRNKTEEELFRYADKHYEIAVLAAESSTLFSADKLREAGFVFTPESEKKYKAWQEHLTALGRRITDIIDWYANEAAFILPYGASYMNDTTMNYLAAADNNTYKPVRDIFKRREAARKSKNDPKRDEKMSAAYVEKDLISAVPDDEKHMEDCAALRTAYQKFYRELKDADHFYTLTNSRQYTDLLEELKNADAYLGSINGIPDRAVLRHVIDSVNKAASAYITEHQKPGHVPAAGSNGAKRMAICHRINAVNALVYKANTEYDPEKRNDAVFESFMESHRTKYEEAFEKNAAEYHAEIAADARIQKYNAAAEIYNTMFDRATDKTAEGHLPEGTYAAHAFTTAVKARKRILETVGKDIDWKKMQQYIACVIVGEKIAAGDKTAAQNEAQLKKAMKDFFASDAFQKTIKNLTVDDVLDFISQDPPELLNTLRQNMGQNVPEWFNDPAAAPQVNNAPANTEVNNAPANTEVNNAPANTEVNNAPTNTEVNSAPANTEVNNAPTLEEKDNTKTEEQKVNAKEEEQIVNAKTEEPAVEQKEEPQPVKLTKKQIDANKKLLQKKKEEARLSLRDASIRVIHSKLFINKAIAQGIACIRLEDKVDKEVLTPDVFDDVEHSIRNNNYPFDVLTRHISFEDLTEAFKKPEWIIKEAEELSRIEKGIAEEKKLTYADADPAVKEIITSGTYDKNVVAEGIEKSDTEFYVLEPSDKGYALNSAAVKFKDINDRVTNDGSTLDEVRKEFVMNGLEAATKVKFGGLKTEDAKKLFAKAAVCSILMDLCDNNTGMTGFRKQELDAAAEFFMQTKSFKENTGSKDAVGYLNSIANGFGGAFDVIRFMTEPEKEQLRNLLLQVPQTVPATEKTPDPTEEEKQQAEAFDTLMQDNVKRIRDALAEIAEKPVVDERKARELMFEGYCYEGIWSKQKNALLDYTQEDFNESFNNRKNRDWDFFEAATPGITSEKIRDFLNGDSVKQISQALDDARERTEGYSAENIASAIENIFPKFKNDTESNAFFKTLYDGIPAKREKEDQSDYDKKVAPIRQKKLDAYLDRVVAVIDSIAELKNKDTNGPGHMKLLRYDTNRELGRQVEIMERIKLAAEMAKATEPKKEDSLRSLAKQLVSRKVWWGDDNAKGMTEKMLNEAADNLYNSKAFKKVTKDLDNAGIIKAMLPFDSAKPDSRDFIGELEKAMTPEEKRTFDAVGHYNAAIDPKDLHPAKAKKPVKTEALDADGKVKTDAANAPKTENRSAADNVKANAADAPRTETRDAAGNVKANGPVKSSASAAMTETAEPEVKGTDVQKLEKYARSALQKMADGEAPFDEKKAVTGLMYFWYSRKQFDMEANKTSAKDLQREITAFCETPEVKRATSGITAEQLREYLADGGVDKLIANVEKARQDIAAEKLAAAQKAREDLVKTELESAKEALRKMIANPSSITDDAARKLMSTVLVEERLITNNKAKLEVPTRNELNENIKNHYTNEAMKDITTGITAERLQKFLAEDGVKKFGEELSKAVNRRTGTSSTQTKDVPVKAGYDREKFNNFYARLKENNFCSGMDNISDKVFRTLCEDMNAMNKKTLDAGSNRELARQHMVNVSGSLAGRIRTNALTKEDALNSLAQMAVLGIVMRGDKNARGMTAETLNENAAFYRSTEAFRTAVKNYAIEDIVRQTSSSSDFYKQVEKNMTKEEKNCFKQLANPVKNGPTFNK